ncbi:MAG: hypothetical protein DME75_07545 [Verrucomicrobia bacterium]|nr:MAG: hypothetical protein DME75_07545 [Verrucomicrobiota bacterium]
MSKDIISTGRIAERIRHVRGENVLLGSDLNRNQDRFSSDFMSQLTTEAERLIFQIGRSKGRGGRRHRPHASIEQGVAKLSSFLKSERAGERTRFACWRWRPRHRERFLQSRSSAFRIRCKRGSLARRRKGHARRVRSPK